MDLGLWHPNAVLHGQSEAVPVDRRCSCEHILHIQPVRLKGITASDQLSTSDWLCRGLALGFKSLAGLKTGLRPAKPYNKP